MSAAWDAETERIYDVWHAVRHPGCRGCNVYGDDRLKELVRDALRAAYDAGRREGNPVESVRRFHEAFGVLIDASWTKPERRELRRELIREEMREYLTAEEANDPAAVLDALVDLVYVTVGAAIEYGFDFAGAFGAVQAANMAKLGPDGRPIVREDGKILKPPGWTAADLSSFVAAAIEAGT